MKSTYQRLLSQGRSEGRTGQNLAKWMRRAVMRRMGLDRPLARLERKRTKKGVIHGDNKFRRGY